MLDFDDVISLFPNANVQSISTNAENRTLSSGNTTVIFFTVAAHSRYVE